MAWVVSSILQLLFTILSILALSGADEIRVPPSIVSPVEPLVLSYTENDRVDVNCTATGQPAPSYKWLWNNFEINSQYITFSATRGILTIESLTTREEGIFVCYAKATFSNGMTATAVSATVEIRVARVEEFKKRPLEAYTSTEGNYVTIPCDKDLPKYYGAITFDWYITRNTINHTGIEDFIKRPIEPYLGIEGNYVPIPCDKDLPKYYGAIIFKWYTVIGTKNYEVFPDERKFVDHGGNLHFSYVLKSDESSANTTYKCAISSIKSNVIRLGNENSLTVTSTASIANSAPKLQYITSGSFLTVEIGINATLECVFSGYIASSIPSERVPRVTWLDQDGRAITQGGRYDIREFEIQR